MSDTIINLITPPDRLFNSNPSLLLLNPSDQIKESFNQCASEFTQQVNLYLFEEDFASVEWLLNVAQGVDHIIIDIDNTKKNHWVIGYLLGLDKTFYLTNEPQTVYNVINVNRIYEVKQFMEGVKYFGLQEK